MWKQLVILLSLIFSASAQVVIKPEIIASLKGSSVAFPPGPGLVLWLDAQDFSYANGTLLSNWVDKSGSFHHFTNLATSSPLFTNNVVNGKSAVRFIGASTSFLLCNTNFMLGIETGHVFAVMKATVSPGIVTKTSPWKFARAGGSGNATHPGTDSALTESFGMKAARVASMTNVAGGSYLTNYHIYEVQVQTNFLNMVYNGNLLAGNDSIITGFTNEMLIGQGTSVNNFWDGEFAEIIMYNNLLSAANREIVYSTLSAKYNLPYTNLTAVYYPTNFAGLAGWWRASNLSSNDGDSVMVWPDESVVGRNYTNPVSSTSPVFKTGIINGQSVLRFNGTSQFMELLKGSINFTNLLTVICVSSNGADTRALLADSVEGDQFRVREGGVNNYLFFNGSSGLSAAGDFGQSRTAVQMSVVVRGPVDGFTLLDSLQFYVNATNAPASITFLGGTITWNRLGKVTTDTSVIYSGDIAEMIQYTNALSLDQITKLYYTYLRPKFNLP